MAKMFDFYMLRKKTKGETPDGPHSGAIIEDRHFDYVDFRY